MKELKETNNVSGKFGVSGRVDRLRSNNSLGTGDALLGTRRKDRASEVGQGHKVGSEPQVVGPGARGRPAAAGGPDDQEQGLGPEVKVAGRAPQAGEEDLARPAGQKVQDAHVGRVHAPARPLAPRRRHEAPPADEVLARVPEDDRFVRVAGVVGVVGVAPPLRPRGPLRPV